MGSDALSLRRGTESLDRSASEKGTDAPSRVVISSVSPWIDGGIHAAKIAMGEALVVEADVFCDGHDLVAAVVHHEEPDGRSTTHRMAALGNDRFGASLVPSGIGRHRFWIEGWVEHLASWHDASTRKRSAGMDITIELQDAAQLACATLPRCVEPATAQWLRSFARSAALGDHTVLDDPSFGERLASLAAAPASTRSGPIDVVVDRELARFSAWYELFPRSTAADPERHGTLRDTIGWVPRIAELGFDVLYLPPIHPIGHAHRKGPDNAPQAEAHDVGSPWAIGNRWGGHTAVHPELGTLEDFRALVQAGAANGLDIALDLAFQCSPDHPWVLEHPEWFRRRSDGSVQYAENPPKRYEDIYPLDFDSPQWRQLWYALREVVMFWIAEGVRVFRVDNPHTKPFSFWEWLISSVKVHEPDVVFLSEAFTRPAPMQQLAKIGFTQSYTYFAWRQTAAELRSYLEELTAPPVIDYFRANAWPSTPDILTPQLHHGGRPALMSRLILASTMFASYGVYGPPYERCETEPRAGAEEYRRNEKYQLRSWDLDVPWGLGDLMARLNEIRRGQRALQFDRSVTFHDVDNDQLICWSKSVPPSPQESIGAPAPGDEPVLVVVNLDPHHRQSGIVDLDLEGLGFAEDEPISAHDGLGGETFDWIGRRQFVALDPSTCPAHVLVLRSAAGSGGAFDGPQ